LWSERARSGGAPALCGRRTIKGRRFQIPGGGFRRPAAALAAAWGLAAAGWALGQQLLGDGNDGNRAEPVHLIGLLDEEGERLLPDDQPALPFSTKMTCGRCHTYDAIGAGWHFNAALGGFPSGRAGQPWVLVDRPTRTQVAVSGRAWPGTFKPEEVGLTPWRMIKLFGRHMPGGGYGQTYDKSPDGADRWLVSGEWPIDCLACHNADRRQNQSEAALQVARENLRWASSVGSGLGSVTGLALTLPGSFDLLSGSAGPGQRPPRVSYDKRFFDDKGRVFFDVPRQGPANRCYFCHSYQQLGEHGDREWRRDEDVHLKAGLTCTDCHRNNLNHLISRGYEGEAQEPGKDESVASLTCQGCHLGENWPAEQNGRRSGRLGAPRPAHRGMPLVHFERLSCTACHSGPRPAPQAGLVKTARIHGLGLHGRHELQVSLPHVASGVFAKLADGKIAPVRLVWPAYWGRLAGQTIKPLAPEAVWQAAQEVLKIDSGPASPGAAAATTEGEEESVAAAAVVDEWQRLSLEQIKQVLERLQKAAGQSGAGEQAAAGEPVYVAGGKVYRLRAGGQVEALEHEAAQPYAWPIAHDVRPAQQALGLAGCDDCHTTDGAFFFGKVPVDTTVQGEQGRCRAMYELEGADGTYTWAFNASFVFRPYLKAVGFTAAGLVGLVVLAFLLAGLRRASLRAGGIGPTNTRGGERR